MNFLRKSSTLSKHLNVFSLPCQQNGSVCVVHLRQMPTVHSYANFMTVASDNVVEVQGKRSINTTTKEKTISKVEEEPKLFDKVLIANRGEITCRIIRSCRKMGITTVAVYSDADANAMHVAMADEAYRLGPAASSESYLLMDHIYKACEDSGAQGVHPGYGFLSENATFMTGLEERGIAFIGPKKKAITAMGDKIASKQIARDAKVNTIPGVLSVIETDEQLLEITNDIGYPVMIKASAGGGGKGMRIAWDDAEAISGFKLSKQEAMSSFGDDTIFVEKFIDDPRHIEIQVLCDSFGNGVYLNERECSIQRRNQKVIEEAPSVLLDPATRKRMGEQALALAKAVDYESAGTVEFLVDSQMNFYFLEMNTRLQVEHPVTELITGVDLVEQMLRVASGYPLSISQKDIPINGWAFESRVYAEDPLNNFLPSIGVLHEYVEPKNVDVNINTTVRVDSGIRKGDQISMFYDPMISKLITYGPDRETALDAMRAALDSYIVRGVKHNINFLRSLCDHPRFIDGTITTKFIEEEYPDGYNGHILSETDNYALAVAAMSIYIRTLDQNVSLSGKIPSFDKEEYVTAQTSHLMVTVGSDENEKCFDLRTSSEKNAESLSLAVQLSSLEENMKEIRASSTFQKGQIVFQVVVDGEEYTLQTVDAGLHTAAYVLQFKGSIYSVKVQTPAEKHLSSFMPIIPEIDTSKIIMSPMPGMVFSVSVKVGDKVFPGQELCIIEAMKMQNSLMAEKEGIVKSVLVKPGDTVAGEDILIELED